MCGNGLSAYCFAGFDDQIDKNSWHYLPLPSLSCCKIDDDDDDPDDADDEDHHDDDDDDEDYDQDDEAT